MKERICNCATCARRDFIRQLGILAGLGMAAPEALAVLPPPVSPTLIPDKRGAVRVRVIFGRMDDIQVKGDWPNVGYDFRPVMKNMVDTLNWQIPGVEFIPSVSNGRAESKAIVLKDEAAGGIDGYMVVHLNSIDDSIYGVWENTKKAIFYTPLPYGGDGGFLMNNSYILTHLTPNYASFCALEFAQVVKVARAFEVLKTGTPADFQRTALAYRAALIPPDRLPEGFRPIRDDVRCRTPEETLAKLRGMKIVSVENVPDKRLADEARATFGIEIVRLTFDELTAAIRKVSVDAARRVAENWKKRAVTVEYVTDEMLLGSARLYLAMKDAVARLGAQAITVNCLAGHGSGKLDDYPCLGFMQLQDEGLFGICENDFKAVLSLMVFSVLANDRMGYISDPVLDMPNHVISYAHCVSTRHFFGLSSPEEPYELMTHSEDRCGVSVRVKVPVGYPITTVKLNAVKRLVGLTTGYVLDNSCDDRACRTKMIAYVNGDFNKSDLHWSEVEGWHRISFYGDMREAVEHFCAKIGYRVVYEA